MGVAISTGSFLLDWVFVIGGALLAVYLYFRHSYQYWKKKGVPYLEPTFPCGNNLSFLSKFPTFAGEATVWYEELKKRGHKFGGVYSSSRPVLVLVHPDYVKDVLSQDFHYFTDRTFYCNEKDDPMGTNLFNIKDPSWRPLRQKLTPTFTSGKMKVMFHTVVSCSKGMISHLEKCERMGDDVAIREVLASFTTDVIGSVAFGIECNSFKDTHPEFRSQGKRLLDEISLSIAIKGMFQIGFPALCERLGSKFGDETVKQFFARVLRESMKYRRKNNIRRPDFLQLMIDMSDSNNKEEVISFEQIVANSILFFGGGFDTSSAVMTFATFELARNPDIQDKVREEANRVLKRHNGELTYEAVKEMTYIRQVIDETTRIYPPAITLDRLCTQDYQLRDTNIIIEKGTPVAISLMGLGRDPEHFPDPMKFDPERFSHDEVVNRHQFIHLPFGEGPRNCIGLRFGKMQSTIGLVRLFTNFRVTLSSKTKTPITIDERMFLIKEKQTIYVNLEKV